MDKTISIEGGAARPAPTRARLLRAMTMAALAAILAVGAVLGLHPRLAEATPRTLARGRPTPQAPAPAPPDDDRERRATAVDDADDDGEPVAAQRGGKRVSGRLNLNTATAAELMLLPGVGPAKAGRIVAWRKRNGSFRRVADLRRVKGFGYRTVKQLEPNLDIKGETTLRGGA